MGGGIEINDSYENKENLFKKGGLFEAIFGQKMQDLIAKISTLLGGKKEEVPVVADNTTTEIIPSENTTTETTNTAIEAKAISTLKTSVMLKNQPLMANVTENKEMFTMALQTVASELDIKPEWLLAVMYSESGLNHRIGNKRGGAVGLIQFMPKTAAYLGTTPEQLKQMTNYQQLSYVKKYYEKLGLKGKMKSIEDVYVATFLPAAVGHSDDDSYIFQSKDLSAKAIASWNPIFDTNKDHQITMKEFKDYIAKNVSNKIQYVPVDQIPQNEAPDMSDDVWDSSYVSEELKDFIKQKEAFSSVSKWDYQQYSRGYGTKAPGGGLRITKAKAEQELVTELKASKERIVKQLQKKGVSNVTQGQMNALISLSYNAGPKRAYDIIDKMAQGLSQDELVAVFEKKSVTAGGKKLPGLVTRRKEEAQMFANNSSNSQSMAA